MGHYDPAGTFGERAGDDAAGDEAVAKPDTATKTTRAFQVA